MNLEEQLKMATSTVAVNAQTGEVSEPITMQVVNPAQIQAEAQVVQPTQTMIQPQLASVTELQMPQQVAVQPQIAETSGVQTIQLGQQVNTKPINLLKKLSIGEKVRFTILPGDINVIKYHFSETIGKIACFSTDQHLGACCRDLGQPKVKFCLPILVYPTMPNDARTIIPNAKAELRILSLWDENTYNTICECVIRNQGKSVDFIATGQDNFGRLDVRDEQTSFAAQFGTDINQAVATYNTYKATVPALIRKNMDEQSYAHVISQVSNNGANYNNSYRGGYQNYNGIMN